MRRICHFLLATMIVTAPMPVAAQVSVDLNALNRLGAAHQPMPPGRATANHHHHHYRPRHLAHAGRHGHHAGRSALATTQHAPAGPDTIEHPANLGPSFTSLPALPGAAPPLPMMPMPLAKPVQTPPVLAPAKPAAPQPAAPSRLAEATPAPPAAQPAPAPNALPKGADRLTLPFVPQASDLPPAETAMLRGFAQHSDAAALYIIRAFAAPPAGDDDPSTPRRIALARAQSVAAALTDAGVQPDRLRLLALGNAGGVPADRVDIIAMPPSSGHTQPNTDSSP
jgi:type IV pilus biogenesis protein CpaD/CtpE